MQMPQQGGGGRAVAQQAASPPATRRTRAGQASSCSGRAAPSWRPSGSAGWRAQQAQQQHTPSRRCSRRRAARSRRAARQPSGSGTRWLILLVTPLPPLHCNCCFHPGQCMAVLYFSASGEYGPQDMILCMVTSLQAPPRLLHCNPTHCSFWSSVQFNMFRLKHRVTRHQSNVCPLGEGCEQAPRHCCGNRSRGVGVSGKVNGGGRGGQAVGRNG